ncbi:MAG: caspase family protein, partial [Pseudomonadota bacterium]|nr:caspase family protein [Pseudomonadota bacterium]
DEPLRFAEEDARKMAQILTRFSGVREENLLLLQGRNAQRVETAFKSMTQRIRAAQADDKETFLVVYYSGHADVSAMHLGRSRLAFDRLTTLLDDAGATFKILIVDACRSGELTRVKGARPAEPFRIVSEQRLKSAGNAIITSSAVGEDAQESDRLRGGVFSHHFMSGLRGAADRSGDQMVSLSEAYRYAYDETIRTTSRARFIQHPTYAYKMKGREDLILTRLADTNDLGRMQLNGAGTWVLLNESNPVGGVLEVTAEEKIEVVVQPGPYLLRLRTTRAVYEGSMEIESGAVARVGRHQLRQIPYGRTIRKGYGRNQTAVWGTVLGAVFTGALTDGVGPNVGAAMGLRTDFRPLTLEVRARGTFAHAENLDVRLTQRALGADMTVLKLFDPGLLSFGFGLRIGVDWIQQTFETGGRSPDRISTVGRAAPILRLEMPLFAQTALVMSGFVDGVMMDAATSPRLEAVPGTDLGLSVVFP